MKCLATLPEAIQAKAERRYNSFFLEDPRHPRLEGKPVPVRDQGMGWSVRIDDNYRALAIVITKDGVETFIWFWIGPHGDYDKLLG